MAHFLGTITRQGFRQFYVRTGIFTGVTVFTGNFLTDCTRPNRRPYIGYYPKICGTMILGKSVVYGFFWPITLLGCFTEEGRKDIFYLFESNNMIGEMYFFIRHMKDKI